MPPKKQKVKVRKTSKSGAKGVNIKIVIDQSKRSKGQAPKAPAQPRALPAFSAMPQGPSFLGASYPNRQDPAVDINVLGDKIYNNLLAEGYRRERQASGFAGFQTAGSQLNQIFDGEYRAGRNNFPIIAEPRNDTSDYVDRIVFDDPETNNQILGNKLNNRGSMLPETGENSIVQVNLDEKRDNALDNLLIREKKSKVEAQVNADLDEELLEENLQNEEVALQEITSPRAQEERGKEIVLEGEEAKYTGRVASPKIRNTLEETYSLPPYPPAKKASLNDLREYIRVMNKEFGTNYDTSFRGRDAVDKLRRVIRIGLLKAYDDL
jgi:hypothetical protein